MIVWGCVATLTSLVKNYVGLVLVRFFLGFVEAPFYPGALYILSLFYTRKEIATRVSILYAGTKSFFYNLCCRNSQLAMGEPIVLTKL
jgi:MFS family permease